MAKAVRHCGGAAGPMPARLMSLRSLHRRRSRRHRRQRSPRRCRCYRSWYRSRGCRRCPGCSSPGPAARPERRSSAAGGSLLSARSPHSSRSHGCGIGEQADDDDRGGDQDPEGQHYRMLVCEIHAALFRATQGSSAHSRSSVPGVQPSAAQTTLIREFRAGVDREVGSVRRLGSVRSRRGGSLTAPERQRTNLAGRVAARSRRAGPTDVHSRPHSGQFPRSPALRRQP